MRAKRCERRVGMRKREERRRERERRREGREPTFEEYYVPYFEERREGKRPNEHRLKPSRDDHLGVDLAVDLGTERKKKKKKRVSWRRKIAKSFELDRNELTMILFARGLSKLSSRYTKTKLSTARSFL